MRADARSHTGVVPFLDLGAVHRPLADDLHAAFRDILESSAFVGGRPLEQFEAAFADFCTTRHAVGVANGTDAIELVLRGMGIGAGDDVIVPANTFVATAEAVVAVGAQPTFVDVDPGTLLLGPDVLASAITPRTAAVIAVHLFGEVADMDAIGQVAANAQIAVIEDAAQAHGALWDEQRAGSVGHAGCFSFYPGKNLGALGDGGAVVTDDDDLARHVRCLANHGRSDDDGSLHTMIGRNSRLDALQAAFLEIKLDVLDAQNQRRREIAALYDSRLGPVPAVKLLDRDPRSKGVHHLYPVRVADREAVRSELEQMGVQTGIHYRLPCHRQPAFEHFSPGVLPIVEEAARTLVSLPMSPTLTDDDVEAVCAAVTTVTMGARV